MYRAYNEICQMEAKKFAPPDPWKNLALPLTIHDTKSRDIKSQGTAPHKSPGGADMSLLPSRFNLLPLHRKGAGVK